MKIPALIGCGILLAALSSGPSVAAGEQTLATVPEILQVQHALRAKLDAPGGVGNFDRAAVQQIETAQDHVFRLLDGVTSLDQLNDQQKVELSNSLQVIQSTVVAQEGSRVICHVERKTGTHLATRRCESVADRERDAAEARKYMLDHPDHIQQPEQGH